MLEKMTEAEPLSTSDVEEVIFIKSELGLHARPAARLVQAAQQFEAHITLEYEGTTADGKSILDLLSLAAGKGASLTLRCHGADAALAAETIREVFSETDF
jgi:phosphocarrier protein